MGAATGLTGAAVVGVAVPPVAIGASIDLVAVFTAVASPFSGVTGAAAALVADFTGATPAIPADVAAAGPAA